MDQRIIHLYDEYVHVHLDRRLFLERAAKLVGSTAAASTMLALLQSNEVMAQIVAENDPRIQAEQVTFAGPRGIVEKAYLATPKTFAKRASIIVIHQNRGINRHVEDVALRFALLGYTSLAVDLLSPFGGTPANEEEGGKLITQLTRPDAAQQVVSAMKYLRARSDATGKVAAVGFCWGGGIVIQAAVEDPSLDVGVSYYGTPSALTDVPKIKTPLLLHYADPMLDPRLAGLAPPFEEALKAEKKTYALYWYPGANHGFNDEGNGPRYHEAAAKLSWGRTLDWLTNYLNRRG